MEKEAAEKVVKRVLEITDELINALEPLQSKCSEADFNSLKLGTGTALVSILDNLLKPIFKQHPDLKPDYMKTSIE